MEHLTSNSQSTVQRSVSIAELLEPEKYDAENVRDFINNRDIVIPSEQWYVPDSAMRGKALITLHDLYFTWNGLEGTEVFDTTGEIAVYTDGIHGLPPRYKAQLGNLVRMQHAQLVYNPITDEQWLSDYMLYQMSDDDGGIPVTPFIRRDTAASYG